MRHGTDALRRRFVPALQSGDLIACQLFSEPSAGSDLASLMTTARRDGEGWRVSGQKVWTSGAHFSDIGEIICRTGEGGRHRNLTAFVIDMRAPGVTVRPLVQMTGSAAFNEVFFDDVWVPDTDRLGDVGDGWSVALTTLANERNAIGGEGFGGSGLLNIDRYIAMVRAFGRDTDPIARQMLADVAIGLRVAKYTRRRAAAGRASGSPPGPEATIDKLALSENVARISRLLATVLGPHVVADTGEWGTYAWSEVILGLPGYKIAGGTDEILKNVIGERVLGLPKEPRSGG
jgi:alkylation response protein AidB-like acyl-CoA dehydrogenase